MYRIHNLCVALILLAASTSTVLSIDNRPNSHTVTKVDQEDWPHWRGPHSNGIASANQTPPLKWSNSQNIVWKVSVPGRGHGSPTVAGGRVYLATAERDAQIQAVICYDQANGKELWKTVVHRGNLETKGNKKASLASATVAFDGERLFVNFLNDRQVTTSALSLSGEVIWQTPITDYVVHQGYGSSPIPHESLVLVSADNKGGGAVAGIRRTDGSIVWKVDRPKTPNYTSPMVVHAGGRNQLVMVGCDLVSSLDPLTGKTLWETIGSTTECVTSTVTDGKLVFTSGGYPKNHVSAVRADGSGKVAWENRTRVYVPSMIVSEGHLFAVSDGGVAICWECGSGDLKWRGRVGGIFSSSPVLVGDKIFATSEEGKTSIFRASTSKFELIDTNTLGEQTYSTPVFCRNRIYMRVATFSGNKRQESLYCIGTKP